MESHINSYITLVTTSAVLNLFLCMYTFFRRAHFPSARLFILYTASLSVYTFGYAIGLASNTLEQMKFWNIIQYIGMPVSAPLGLLLMIRYTGKKLSKGLTSALFIIPSITVFMVTTNDWHHLYYKRVWLLEDSKVPIMAIDFGQWYVVHGAFTFSCLLFAGLILMSQWRHTKKMYRRQLLTLIASQVIPMIAAFVYLLGLTPFGLDPVPVLMCVTSAMYIWAILSSRLLTIVPIAKESIFESMREGVIVLDSSYRLVDFNRSLQHLLPEIQTTMVGRPLNDIWLELAGETFPVEYGREGLQTDLYWQLNDETVCYQVRTSYVFNKSPEAVGILIMLINITEQRFLEEQLKQLAYFDGLTKIYNRTQFLYKGRELLNEAQLNQQPISFILFDIDHFKRINDTYGHDIGDQAIIHVVSVCNRYLSSEMLFARYGGEEFVIALPNMTLHEAHAQAEQLRTSLLGEPLDVEGQPVILTSSFGIAQSGSNSDTLESLLRDADHALYEAKRQGRNAVSVYAVNAV
ncbi:diguanylate cyclase [Paenibacillus barcinonensis]|uniref:Diguanylate cyclase n=1 Tax=Paenibacillus barcinonensis TaxID=198119 RepID=A0A2V4VXI0_PAEBA|nr:histidine kinase N-terminal 7TM domain-containing protein [Paenibacillus barcinonensis]PYE52465.1 diguanylate cyclase (GGDEF)-like protein [Paenibacillus barcinonensis]QKS59427.1 diguanylate cyclase [Paenibacillus barcinonensis]